MEVRHVHDRGGAELQVGSLRLEAIRHLDVAHLELDLSEDIE